MSVLWRHQLLLGLIAGLVFFTNLGGYALFDEDESKNAGCGREMFARGDWIVPTFNGDLRTDKPILTYWWMHLSFRTFGVSEFSARFGSALLAALTVLLTYHLGRMLYSPETGFLAGIILATSLMFSAIGRAATPDATLIFCLMISFTGYVWAVARRRGGHFCGNAGNVSISLHPAETGMRRSVAGYECGNASFVAASGITPWTELLPATRWTTIPMYAGMGLAILAKGPIGVLIPCMIVGLFLLVSMRRSEVVAGRLASLTGPWWRRSILVTRQILNPVRILRVGLAMRLLLGVVIVLIVASPWYVIVSLRTEGAWLRGFLGDHNLRRFVEPRENHGGPFFYYLIVLFFGCFPWSAFLPLAVWQLVNRLARANSLSDNHEVTEALRHSAHQRQPQCDAWSDSDRFLICWMSVWLVFFSLASTKLPNYVLPIYPAMAIVISRYLGDWQRSGPEWSTTVFRNCCRAYGVIGVLAMGGIPIATSLLCPGEEWLLVIGALPLAGAAAAFAATVRERRRMAIRILSVTAVLLTILAIGVAPTRLGTLEESPKLIEAARQISGKDHPDIAVVDGFSPSLIFYAKHPIPHLKPDQVAGFLDAHPGGFIVTRSDRVGLLPADGTGLAEVSRCDRLLRPFDLVLLARSARMTNRSDLQRR